MEAFGSFCVTILFIVFLLGYSFFCFSIGAEDKDEQWRKWCVEKGYAQYNTKTGEWEEVLDA